MPRKVVNALTPISVKNAKPGRYADGGGLYLFVKPTGARTWVFRATIAGKVRDIGLGSADGHDAIRLADARELARDKAREVATGSIPISDRRARIKETKQLVAEAKSQSKPFREVADAFIEMHESRWRNPKSPAQWRSSLETYVYPHFGATSVADITTEHVLKALQPIWKEKSETASRLRGRIENILDAAKVQELRTGENPARWRGHLDHLLPKRSKLSRGHHKALPYAQTPDFMADLSAREAIAARALEFTILTAARSREVREATWAEIDLDAALWTVPAEHMKAGREHRVPLSHRAIRILKSVEPLNLQQRKTAPLFPANSGAALSGMAMSMLLRRMRSDGITVHGFRSTFRDWAAERTTFAHEVCEMALAHTISNKAEAAYRRGDLFEKRRQLMETWDRYVSNSSAKL